MSPDFYPRVRQLFDLALERPREERSRFVQNACAGDPILLRELEELIRAHDGFGSFLASDSRPITRIGRFVIRGELGRGAMGVVYDAIDPVIGRSVAVKMIHLKAAPAEAEFMKERLFREARSAGQLSHPGIVTIFDVGQEGDSAFIAMERVNGPSIQQILASRRLKISEALDILEQTATALDYAHQHGVVHRDIKPANIMLHAHKTVKVADFGIAKVVDAQHATLSGMVMGTPSYMSPEQIEAQHVDGRSDQFSVAVLAYELLTGNRPFQADSIATLAHQIVYSPRPSARAVNPALPESVDQVLKRGLNRSPDQRFHTCTEFVRALRNAFRGAEANTLTIAPNRASGGAGNTRGKSWVYAVVLVTLLAALAIALLFFRGYWGGGVTATASVNQPPKVRAAPAAVASFQADPVLIEAGESALLRWQTSGSTQTAIDNGIGAVPANGAVTVRPAQSTVYVLTASGSGSKARATVSLQVKPKSVPPANRAQELYALAIAKRRSNRTEEAIPLFRQAADLGDARAMIELGESYRSGDGVPEDATAALQWFHRAADAGNSTGMVLLGAMYLLGEGAEQDDETAVRWFQKAADRKNSAAIYDLGTMYEDGRGVAVDLEKARQLYQKAADLGNTEAQHRLAELQK